ncbi:lipoyl(octanoyl) transferase LipB [Defluviicoccus vanus]|uniref:Octanoyltransferase n=2 Tax=Defluviicoccus vanus TaxID=111831 RepID=A0A7H1N6N5_9PROT|nr:lipoyl(octanoyl) transferase LipB [Defluviicoccus vanus]
MPLPMQWLISDEPVDYPQAVRVMEERVAAIRRGTAAEAIWLLEHPPLYTAGTSAGEGELLDANRFPVYASGRGGRYTYHGPGQRVAYVMLDLACRGRDVRAFVHSLEAWIIAALARFGVAGERRQDRVGIWVTTPAGEAKIAALGVRVRRWVSYHGIAINLDPELSHFAGIVPCGLAAYGVTSLAALGVVASLDELDQALRETFSSIFDSNHSQLSLRRTTLAEG